MTDEQNSSNTNEGTDQQQTSAPDTQDEQGSFFSNTETPQHLMQDALKAQPEGPRFSSTLEEAKTNGWGIGISTWMGENKQMIFGIAASLILATIAIVAIRSYLPIAAIPTTGDLVTTNESISIDTISNTGNLLGFGNVRTETAEPGEGITHLARRAVALHAASMGISLSPEQRIYAEDYVQNAIGTHTINPGEKLSFTPILLNEAIAAAQALSEAQIQNLSQYSALVAF